MKRQIFSLSLILAGMSMLAVYLFIYYLPPPSPQGKWTEDQAKKLQRSQVEFHNLSHSHQHASTAAATKEQAAKLAAAKAEWEARQAELKAVTSATEGKANILFWAGIVVTVLGVLTFRPVRDDEDE